MLLLSNTCAVAHTARTHSLDSCCSMQALPMWACCMVASRCIQQNILAVLHAPGPLVNVVQIESGSQL
jgi:hypothetical protein